MRFDESSIGPDPEAYLAAREAEHANIRAGLAKEIVWADHGSPAAHANLHRLCAWLFRPRRAKCAPLPDLVASELGANLFYTRLTGHGQDGAAMAQATAERLDRRHRRGPGHRARHWRPRGGDGDLHGPPRWRAGRRQDPNLAEGVAAMVLIAPNYRINGTGAGLLSGPWGAQLARLLLGPERGFEPENELQASLWTSTYPTSALMPLAATVAMTRTSPVEDIDIPALFVFSNADKIVEPPRHASSDRALGRADACGDS